MHASSQWRSAAGTDPGKVRARNEDAVLDCPELGLWAVADGMGGHRAGDIASQLIVDSLGELTQPQTFDQRLEAVRQCLHWLNRRMGQELTVSDQQVDSLMGSTVVALLLEGKRAACVWAGDSRCYLWRGQQLYQLSRDHSLQQQLMDEQHLSFEEALAHPGSRALTRAIGASEHLNLSVVELEVLPDDVFLLCSDGLYQGLSHRELGQALSLISPQVALARLFDGVLRGAACDNVSAVVIRQ
ncbi:PP2C family serine/threonine-protein phosphatase [Pseudomonas sp. CCC3.1]|uniref:PP2C family protein-serine/threonine phosphatase n=1 Tax=Pseudomonas sp. CCC3.1 TaxID=3048607 RepID=UPI002AC90532|nr:PP2C family serine/threonine-protein phosphatase [Pseudomonas sp. CCC3.1]MEB0206059.1 serine/threonine-protein phosphatase [Pseudomonas sp. CCC3.1]WPX36725.1 serine/threonine-protein phosphatase [Pseudomonas sp. CCC3.1]